MIEKQLSLANKVELYDYLRAHPEDNYRINECQSIYYDPEFDYEDGLAFSGLVLMDEPNVNYASEGQGIVIRTERMHRNLAVE